MRIECIQQRMYFDASSDRCRTASIDCLPQANSEFEFQGGEEHGFTTFTTGRSKWPPRTNKIASNHTLIDGGGNNTEKHNIYRSHPIFDNLEYEEAAVDGVSYARTLPQEGGVNVNPRSSVPHPMLDPLIPGNNRDDFHHHQTTTGNEHMRNMAPVKQIHAPQPRPMYADPMLHSNLLHPGGGREGNNNRSDVPVGDHDNVDMGGEPDSPISESYFKYSIKDLLAEPSWFPAWLIASVSSICIIALIIIVLVLYE